MKKIAMLTFFLLSLISCSDDDNDKTGSISVLLPETIDVVNAQGETHYQFAYDSARRIKTMIITGANNLAATYLYNEDNLVTSVNLLDNDAPTEMRFEYDADNRLKKYINGNNIQQLTYNETTQTYTIEGLGDMGFTANGDIASIGTTTIEYTDMPGVFRNIGGTNMNLINFFIDGIFMYSGGYSSMEQISVGGEVVIKMAHTLDANGFPIKSVSTQPAHPDRTAEMTIKYSSFPTN